LNLFPPFADIPVFPAAAGGARWACTGCPGATIGDGWPQLLQYLYG
jgi:hypothetical protein